jgi:hypothetical protein
VIAGVGPWRSRIVWAGIGVAVGFAGGLVVGLAVGGNLAAPVLGAVAGSAAAIIAAAALAWNVHNGRLERADRRATAQRAAQDAGDHAAEHRRAAAEALLVEAASVTVEVFGGGGFGQNASAILVGTSIHLRLVNGSTMPVSGLFLVFDPPIQLKNPRGLPGSLSAGETFDQLLETEPFDLPKAEASRARLLSHRYELTYRLGGRTWRRVEDEMPTEISAGAAVRAAAGSEVS